MYRGCRARAVHLPAPGLIPFLHTSPEQAADPRKGYDEGSYGEHRMKVHTQEVFGRIGEAMSEGRWMAENVERKGRLG